MAQIRTKLIPKLDSASDQTLVLRAGGNSLSTYSQAVVLLEQSEPQSFLYNSTITCEEQQQNSLKSFRVEVEVGTLLKEEVTITVTIPSLEMTVIREVASGTKYEETFSDTSSNLKNAPSIFISISGRTSNNEYKVFNKDQNFTVALDCESEVEPINCFSNSSQIVFETSLIGLPVKVQIEGQEAKLITSLGEFVEYLQDNKFSINFYYWEPQ